MASEAWVPEVPASDLWADFAWPEWVPQRERDLIEKFWSKDCGRGPRGWAAGAAAPYNGAIPMGTTVRAWPLGRGAPVVGRYVHRWNNTGVVVRADGVAVAVSGVATDEAIDAVQARIEAAIASHAREVERLRDEAAALTFARAVQS